MNIGAVLTTDKGLKKCVFPQEEMILELVRALKEKGTEQIVLNDGIYQTDGIYIPGKGSKSAIMVLPMEDEDGKVNGKNRWNSCV